MTTKTKPASPAVTETKADGADLIARITGLIAEEPPSRDGAANRMSVWEFQKSTIADDLQRAKIGSRDPVRQQIRQEAREKLETTLARHELSKPATFDAAARRAWLLKVVSLEDEAVQVRNAIHPEYAEMVEANTKGQLSMAEAKRLRDLSAIRDSVASLCNKSQSGRGELLRLAPGGILGVLADIEQTVKGLQGFGVCGSLVDDLKARLAGRAATITSALLSRGWDELEQLDTTI